MPSAIYQLLPPPASAKYFKICHWCIHSIATSNNLSAPIKIRVYKQTPYRLTLNHFYQPDAIRVWKMEKLEEYYIHRDASVSLKIKNCEYYHVKRLFWAFSTRKKKAHFFSFSAQCTPPNNSYQLIINVQWHNEVDVWSWSVKIRCRSTLRKRRVHFSTIKISWRRRISHKFNGTCLMSKSNLQFEHSNFFAHILFLCAVCLSSLCAEHNLKTFCEIFLGGARPDKGVVIQNFILQQKLCKKNHVCAS